MRTESEMLDLIIRTAKEDSRIRAAYLEGSRVNPKVPGDIFQDYDVVYIVEETLPFREDRGWIDRFGRRLYMQFPEEGPYFAADVGRCYGWLMQFADGNRLDLHVCTAGYALANLELYRTLVDKDGLMPESGSYSDERYWVKRPSYEEFQSSCNEFRWCLNNVAKGLWREEMPYVMDMLDLYVRPMLKRLLEWEIGSDFDFSVSPGKMGKYMKKYLPETTYRRFLATYPHAETNAVWEAVMGMCDLFEETAAELGKKLNFRYDFEEAANSRGYLEHIRQLPAHAQEIYK